MGKKKKTFEIGFFFRHEFKEQLRRMKTVSQVMEVLDAATDYVMTDNYSIQDPFSDLAFSAWKPCLKYEKETYLQVCEQNKINRQKRDEKKIKKQQQPELFKEEAASEEGDVPLVEAEEVEPYPFVEFWNTFNFKRNKQTAEKAWKKLNNKDRAAAMAAIPNYHAYLEHKRATGFNQNNLYPATYLNERRWEDDYSITDTPQNYGNNNVQYNNRLAQQQRNNETLRNIMEEAAAAVRPRNPIETTGAGSL